MNYVGQKNGEVTLLPDEIPGLVFTEDDRRVAKKAIHAKSDGGEVDLNIANRLYDLMTYGRSFQASVLLGQLVDEDFIIRD